MMIANVMRAGPLTRGTVRGLSDSDTYVFDLPSPRSAPSLRSARWNFQGKVSHDVFIPAGEGYEFIPQEFYAALDQAYVTNGPVEFRDPFLDDLAVQGA